MIPILIAILLGLSAPPPGCEERPGAPSADLYCIELFASGAASSSSGVVRLERAPSPFGLAVTPDGRIEFETVFEIADLPDPGELGPYETYVAWATTPVLDPVAKLGEVGNGTTVAGRVVFDKFLVLVSAEPSAEVSSRSGPLVLRGQSPSMRLQPHDLARLLSWAAMPTHRRGAPEDGKVAPPMHPAVSRMAGLEGVRPPTAPYVPAAHPDSAPPARSTRVVDLVDGDSLALVAGPIRRTVEGKSFTLYGFNGQSPGPLIRVPKDATITVGFTNRTDLPATIHWHGIRLENRFDGVPGVTQEAVPPGGSFRYEVVFPDAGIYWYHPHHRADALQDLGLFGNLMVRPPGPPPPVDREEVLVLDDILVAPEGMVPHGREEATHAMMGRFGNVTLVNGEPRWSRAVVRGEVVRYYLTNVANTRVFNVSFDAPTKLVGADVGRFEREERVGSVVLAPAERAIVDVLYDEPGEKLVLHRARGVDHVYGSFFEEADTLGVVKVGSGRLDRDRIERFDELRRDPEAVAEIDRYRDRFDRPPDEELVLTLEVGDLPFPVRPLLRLDAIWFPPIEWAGTMPRMNWATTPGSVRWILRDPATGKENAEIDWRFDLGDVVKIRIANDRDAFHAMHHPIHLHGQRFLVLSVNGRASRNLAWKDTVVVPAGGSVEILLELSNPGEWMLHCHVSEHLEAGMKTVFRVEPPAAGSPIGPAPPVRSSRE